MTALLRILPPKRPQFRPRRATPSGAIVVHTAETAPDFVPPDGAAENVAKFIQSRSDAGSYHWLVDSDSRINLVAYEDEAYHDGTGGNRWSIGISAATFAASWDEVPADWRDATIRNLATVAANSHRWLKANGFPGCPAKRITRAEYRDRRPGFISHAELDPGRRSDPGPGFPWDAFLAEYARQTKQRYKTSPPQETDDMSNLHAQVPLAVDAIDKMYERYAIKRPEAKRFPETPEALEYQLNRYFSSDDPAAFLVTLGKELAAE